MSGYGPLPGDLQQSGWVVGRNINIEYRWNASDAELVRRNVGDLLVLKPDVFLVAGGRNLSALQRVDREVPVVFVSISDPLSGGFIESFARPGGNATGFSTEEYGISAKRLQLLKEVTPTVQRVGVLRDVTNPAGNGQLGAALALASTLRVEVKPISVRNTMEIERGVATFAQAPNGGLLITSGLLTAMHRKLIVALAADHRLPAVYPARRHVDDGGLISYGADFSDQFRQAAAYVDRILKGEKPADLPVQAPTKYELVINLKTAKVLKIEVPSTVLARADEVIE